jgi:uncharacterized repeat protein (TIGR03803 family)
MSNRKPRPGRFAKRLGPALAMALVLVATTTYSVEAQTYTLKVLYSFTGVPDGQAPTAGLVLDADGNLYGTTLQGGNYNSVSCPSRYNNTCGTVFKVSANGDETILYSFSGSPDGSNPQSTFIRDAAGNLYGTTVYGGEYSADEGGTVFKLDPTGKETILHSFPAFEGDGVQPYVGLRRDKEGNLYGTTNGGGSSTNCDPGVGCGTVFKIDPTGVEAVLHSFTSNPDGGFPINRLTRDGAGNLYGTTGYGGAYGDGTVFKLDATYTETVLNSFTGSRGGSGLDPEAGLVLDTEGNMYGSTCYGGAYDSGTVFKLDTAGKETVLHSFGGGKFSGACPGDLVRDKEGNLYGATYFGGASNNGTVFKVSQTGKETVLHTFCPKGTGFCFDGAGPYGGLVRDGKGNFHGTTTAGGNIRCNFRYGCGTVFKLTP